MPRKASDARIALALLGSVLIAYLLNAGTLPPDADSVPNIYLPTSVIHDGDAAFSPFEAPFMFLWTADAPQGGQASVNVSGWLNRSPGSTKSYAEHYQEGRLKFAGWRYYLVPTLRERAQTGEPQFVGTFGPVAGLTMLPLAALAYAVGLDLGTPLLTLLGKSTAALLVAGSVALVYLTAVRFVSQRRSMLVAAAYAFGSCAWAVASQSLWQQTPEMFFLALGIFFLMREDSRWRGLLAGLALATAAACRPTAALVALLAGGWLLVSDRRALALFVLGALPLAIAALSWNYYYFGNPFEFGQLAAGQRVAHFKTGSDAVWQTPFWLGAAGLLLSPSRGLLVYSPFLAAAFAGAFLAWRDARFRALRFLTLAVLALWVPAFLWFDWWGGWTFGYRPIMDSLPMLVLLCIPSLDRILERPALRAVFFAALAWSVFVQALGAFAYSPWGWNMRVMNASGEGANVDLPAYQHRLWSFRDWQIGYLIANFRQARLERNQPIAY